MGFPLSLIGQMHITGHGVVDARRTCERLRNALVAQTVERIRVDGSTVHFEARVFDRVERPGGGRWIFALYDSGSFHVGGADGATIGYRLSTARKLPLFVGVTALCFLLAAMLDAPGRYMLALIGIIGVAAVIEAHRSRARRFRDWLALVVVSDTPPDPGPMEYAEID